MNLKRQFIKRFFKNIVNGGDNSGDNYYILKEEVDLNELINKLEILINKFGINLQLPLRINPKILLLCKSVTDDSIQNSANYLKTYFTNNRLGFRSFYNAINMITIPKNNTNNNATFLKIPNNRNDIFKRYSEAKKAKQYELQRKLMY